MISQWYEPETGSAAMPASIARALQSRGYETKVLTGFPNYPTGKIYPGYRLARHTREQLDGIDVHRVPLYPSHDRSPVRRMANFASFAVASAAASTSCLADVDVALVYSTPATVGLAGLALRRFRGIPFVLLIQDMWPDTLLASEMLPSFMERPAWWLTDGFCHSVYEAASKIAVIAPSMRDLLVQRGVPASKIEVVFNWADETIFGSEVGVARERHESEPFELMYAGSLGDVQGLDVAVKAMRALPDAIDVRLRFIGGGVAEGSLRRLVDNSQLGDKVSFEGPRPLNQMPSVMASAHAQLLCLRDLPMFHGTIPSKFQAILASGQPLVASAPGDVARLTAESGAGLAVPPEQPEALADAIEQLECMSPESLREMGRRGRSFYRSEFSEPVGAARLMSLLEDARKESRPRCV